MTYFSIHKEYEYYQGFHDIVAVISLLNFKDEEVLYYIDKLTRVYFSKYLTTQNFSGLLLDEIDVLVKTLSTYITEIDPEHLRLCCMSKFISAGKCMVVNVVFTRAIKP